MTKSPPRVVLIGGPNGAGKTTVAPRLLRGPLAVDEFVNADTLAAGMSLFHPERASLAAGRVMLVRLHELAAARASFAFETTLASRTFAPWLTSLDRAGYACHVLFLSLPSADAAVERVTERVRAGGHAVPEDVIRRRYDAGLRNLFGLYLPLAATWRVYDNSGPCPRLVAGGTRGAARQRIMDRTAWMLLRKAGGT